jgi:hypothetical protein
LAHPTTFWNHHKIKKAVSRLKKMYGNSETAIESEIKTFESEVNQLGLSQENDTGG